MRIAVVGSGIAGLTAAWSLSTRHEVTLFEKSGRLGMDAHALDLDGPSGTARVDVPLRVFFEGFYPNVTAMYRALGIGFKPINYSASFGLLGQPSYFRYDNVKMGRWSLPLPQGWRSLKGTGLAIGFQNLRFFRQIRRELAQGIADDITLSEYLERRRYASAFTEGFLYPAFAGICTCSYASVKAYPARVILEYLNSQLLLSSVQRVTAGTQSVVDLMARRVQSVRLGAEIHEVRDCGGSAIVRHGSESHVFDHVVIATQANQTMQLLRQDAQADLEVLRHFRYEPSRVVVHTDSELAPAGGKRAWAPVNFLLRDKATTPMATIWLNAIQPLDTASAVFQTWNPIIEPDAEKILGEAFFERPVVTPASLRALAQLQDLRAQPNRRLWFCGSYASHGIPLLESAAVSALLVAERLGCPRPWPAQAPVVPLDPQSAHA